MGLWDSALYLTSAALWATDELGYFRNLPVVQGDHFQHMLPRGFSRELTCIDGWAISAVSILPGKVVTLHRLLIWSVWELAGTCIRLLEGGLLRS